MAVSPTPTGSSDRGDTTGAPAHPIAGAAEDLLPLVYEQLRGLARRQMAAERDGHTLQPTALVHEAYLRLLRDRAIGWASRAQFFSAAAEAMRRILVEHARARGRLKRGGAGASTDRTRRVPLSVLELATGDDPAEILALDEAVRRLEQENADLGAVVRLRFYAGLSIDETAEMLGISPRSVKRDWSYARAWLFRVLGY
jgi:RNA polymerase sigma factor (TIGR02999 family)